MKFCSTCGAEVKLEIPQGDDRERFICNSCQEIHYQNPKIVTGCIAEWEDKILICKRAIEPKRNKWTLPAGFMENGETNKEGAARESQEEANIIVQDMILYSVYSIPHISQVYTFYRATVKDGMASPGKESLETRFVSQDEVPWDELAFPVIIETLKLYYQDKQSGIFRTHYGDIIKQADQSLIVINH